MTEREQQQAELLERYWEALAGDPEAAPPAALDPRLAAITRRLERHLRPPAPAPGFDARLWRALGAPPIPPRPNGQPPAAPRHWPALRLHPPTGRWTLVRLAAATIVVLVLLGGLFVALRPQPVSAQEILQKAQATAADVAAGGVHSFALTRVTAYNPDAARAGSRPGTPAIGATRSEMQVWFQAPDHWRYEIVPAGAPGQDAAPSRRVTVADGQTVWRYDPTQNLVQIDAGPLGGSAKGGFLFYDELSLGDGGDLAAVLQQVRICYNPVVAGKATVAGRPAYVVELGATKCPSASAADLNGPQTLWVDTETFFVLKRVIADRTGSRAVQTTEVTSIRYNLDLPTSLFTFTPPLDAQVRDSRPKPTPDAEGYQRQLTALAEQVDFPLFTPREMPAGLVPRAPRLDPTIGVELAYVPPAEAETAVSAELTGLDIVEQRATDAQLARWTDQAEPTAVPGGQGWVRRGGRRADGTGTNSAAIVLRDGTLIAVTSFARPPEELVAVAASLEPVPGGHAPLANPTPPTVAQLRQRVTFPVFVPTAMPAGLTPEPPRGGEQPTAVVELRYRGADGSVALSVVEGPAGCCLAADPRKVGEPVALPNGSRAHYLANSPQFGGPILWWEQEGTYIGVSGPYLTEADLIKIAASMSKTTDAGPVTPPPKLMPTP